jgi:ATP/ADP translocase
MIDLVVNSTAALIQLLGMGRFIQRFGVKTGLLLNPIIMLFAFMAITLSPILMILAEIQIVRRVAEHAGREIFFTVVDEGSQYKATNVIDTVVHCFGGLQLRLGERTHSPAWRDGTRELRCHHIGDLVPDCLPARPAL